MSTVTVNVTPARAPAIPRGARLVAGLFTRLGRWLTTPPQKRALTRAEEAAAVRELAYRLQATDPGLASDLYGAAARHESLDD